MNICFPCFDFVPNTGHDRKHLSCPNLELSRRLFMDIPDRGIHYRLSIQTLLTIEQAHVQLYLRAEGHCVGGGCPFLPLSHTRGVEPSAPSHHAFLHDLTSAGFSLISPRILRTVIREHIIRSSLVSFLFISFRGSYHEQLLWVLLQLPATTQTTM